MSSACARSDSAEVDVLRWKVALWFEVERVAELGCGRSMRSRPTGRSKDRGFPGLNQGCQFGVHSVGGSILM